MRNLFVPSPFPVVCNPQCTDLYTPVSLLQSDFLTFCRNQRVRVPFAHAPSHEASRRFNALISQAMPAMPPVTKIVKQLYGGEMMYARFRHGIVLLSNSAANATGGPSSDVKSSASKKGKCKIKSEHHSTGEFMGSCLRCNNVDLRIVASAPTVAIAVYTLAVFSATGVIGYCRIVSLRRSFSLWLFKYMCGILPRGFFLSSSSFLPFPSGVPSLKQTGLHLCSSWPR